ncbi:MAG: thiolase family protein [Oscillospiraceae bacterium]
MADLKLARSVSIISTGYTPLGDVRHTPQILNMTERELFAMASIEAMDSGNIGPEDIDAYYVGMSGPNYSNMKSAAPFFGEWIGLRNRPTIFHDEGCGSMAFGLDIAVQAVASGKYDCVLSGAVNINSCVQKPGMPPQDRVEFSNDALWASVYASTDSAYQAPAYSGVGPTEAVLVRYMIDNHLKKSDIEDCFIGYLKSKRREAMTNPKATRITMSFEDEAKHFGFDSVDDYLRSNKFNPYMSYLVRARYLGQIIDGASAVIVCATDMAKKYVEKPIEVAGIYTIGSRDNQSCVVPTVPNTVIFPNLYKMAGITDPASQIDYLGVHDCPATMVLDVSEAAGYIPKGEAWKYMRDGEMAFDGKKPITTSGGRTQSGHPRSPAFIIEVDEAVKQMRGENGPRQMKKIPKISVVWGGGAGFNTGAVVLKSL